MIVARPGNLLVVALDQLDAVGHGPRGDQEGDHEGQGVEVVAQQGNNAQPPGCRDENPHQRQQDAVYPSAEVHHQQGQQNRQGEKENLQNLIQIAVDPAHQYRLPGSIDVHTRGGLAGPQLLHFVLQLAELPENFHVIQLPFIEGATDQGRFQIGGHQQPVDRGIGHDIQAHLRQLRGTQIRVKGIVIGLGVHVAHFREPSLAHGTMGQAAHQVVVHSWQRINALGQAVYPRQCVAIEDGPLFHRYRHDHVIGAAEGILDLVVQLNVGMLLRQQVREVRIHLEVGYSAGKKHSREKNRRQENPGVVEDKDFHHAEKAAQYAGVLHS